MRGKTRGNSIKMRVVVNAPLGEVYLAFTNGTALSEWLCTVAQADARPGGRLYLWWERGYYASGEFTRLVPDQQVKFSWIGRHDPGSTQVKISLIPLKGGTQVRLAHQGMRKSKAWKRARRSIKRGWKTGLDNLKSVLETGQDLRFVRRPVLGFSGQQVTPSLAKQLNLPIKHGVLLNTVVSGMGAEAAGLQKGDVLVKLAGQRLGDILSMQRAIENYQAGDIVKVIFYRGQSKYSGRMALSPRPIPAIPATAEALAESLRQAYQPLTQELVQAAGDASMEAIAYTPIQGEWSSKEILAHLILTEIETQNWIAGLVEGQEHLAPFQVRSPTRMAGLVKVFPDLIGMVRELALNQVITIAMIHELPSEFIARKRSYWRLAYSLLEMPTHLRNHSRQVLRLLQAAGSQQKSPTSTEER